MTASTEDVEQRVASYLDAAAGQCRPGEDEYYMQVALAEALQASREGNYGIGAVVVVLEGTTVLEYRARSAMVTALGVVDHAETRGLLAVGTATPDAEYSLAGELRSQPKAGISVYGTLEPCPLCSCAMANAGVTRSVSGVIDGTLVVEDGMLSTDGSAEAIGEKRRLQPRVWRQLQDEIGLEFELLTTTDTELRALCWDIFAVRRNRVDRLIAERGPLHRR